jgi:exonuclease V gamma subunit
VPAAEADLGGLLETAEALQAKLQAALLASHRFTSTATSALAGDLGSLPPSVMRSRLLVAANRMGQPSVELQQTTAEAYREVSRFDALLRAMQADLAETSVADDVAESMSQISSTVDFDSTLKGLREVSQLMRAFSGLSVPLRKSLAPAVNGVNALVKTLETVRSWASLPGRTRPEGT